MKYISLQTVGIRLLETYFKIGTLKSANTVGEEEDKNKSN